MGPFVGHSHTMSFYLTDSHKCKSLLALRTALHKELSHLKYVCWFSGSRLHGDG